MASTLRRTEKMAWLRGFRYGECGIVLTTQGGSRHYCHGGTARPKEAVQQEDADDTQTNMPQ